jgi:hypothetical protein
MFGGAGTLRAAPLAKMQSIDHGNSPSMIISYSDFLFACCASGGNSVSGVSTTGCFSRRAMSSVALFEKLINVPQQTHRPYLVGERAEVLNSISPLQEGQFMARSPSLHGGRRGKAAPDDGRALRAGTAFV